MRALAVFFGLIATLAGAYGGFWVMRELGPGDLTGQYGRGDAAAIDGNLMQSKNFALVIAALERELGADGRIQQLSVEPLQASSTSTVDGRLVRVQVDTAGRSQKEDVGEGTESGTMPVAKLDPKAVDRITRAAMKETGSPVESLSLYGANREWRVEMLRGEPDSFIANLNGRGLRLSGEPNPDPLGASPDSLMRAKNFQKVLNAIGKEGNRVLDITLWPERASVVVEKGGRAVNLNYGYDAELTSRDVAALNGAQTESIPLKSIDPKAIERMAKSRYVKGLKHAMYAILRPAGVFEDAPQWLLYLPQGNDPTYVTANIKGRGLSWPGRG
jgi:hypothetical protein